MSDVVLIPLPGVGTLELTREAYEAALRPIAASVPSQVAQKSNALDISTELVTAKVLARQTSLPISCIYEYARAGRIPCVRAGKHVRFNAAAVRAALETTANQASGHA